MNPFATHCLPQKATPKPKKAKATPKPKATPKATPKKAATPKVRSGESSERF